jgi:Domain of unknown function (DUF397)
VAIRCEPRRLIFRVEVEEVPPAGSCAGRALDEVHVNGPRFAVSSSCHEGGCVAVAALPGGAVAVHDNTSADGPTLEFTAEEWTAFLAGVKNSEFDMTDSSG